MPCCIDWAMWPGTTGSGDYFVAENATVLGRVRSPSASIWFNAVLRGDQD